MAETTHASVLLSFLDYRAVYREPVFDLDKLDNEACRAAYLAFRPWNVALENITFKEDPVNVGEIATHFAFPSGRFVFSIGVGAIGFFVTNPNWSEAELAAKVLRTGLDAVRKALGTTIEKQVVNISFHAKPSRGSVRDFTANLVHLKASPVPEKSIRAYGLVMYTEDSTWVVDASALDADALFLRIQRTFSPDVTLDTISAKLHEDEKNILGLLRLEVE